jgi:mannosyltransferase
MVPAPLSRNRQTPKDVRYKRADVPTMETAERSGDPAPAWPPLLVVAAVAVILIGLIMRFWTRSHLWLDEALTVNIAGLPLSEIPRALRHDGAPPLYYFVLHFWMRVFGTSAAAVRALSGVFAVATIPVMWFAGRRLAHTVGAYNQLAHNNPTRDRPDGDAMGAVAVLLLVSSPFAVHYATEARMYSLVVLLALLGYLAMGRALDQRRPSLGQLLPISLVSGLLLLTHYWSLYLLATVGAMLAIGAIRTGRTGTDQRGAQIRVLVAVGAGAVIFLPWIPSFLFQLRHTGTPWAEPASFSAMVNAISEFAGGRSSSGRALGLAFFALAGFGLFGAPLDRFRVEIDLRTRPGARALAVTVAGTLAVAIAVGLATQGAFAARYTAVVFAPFLLLVTLGAAVLVDRRLLTIVVVAIVGFGLATSTGNITTDRTQAGQLAALIRAELRPGDVVGYCPDQLGPALSRLLPPGVIQVTFPRETGPTFVDWVDYAKRVKAADPVHFAELLDQRAGSGHTVWMVWAGQYRKLGTDCEQINARLTALRPDANQLREADTEHFFEHANLARYRPR